MSQTDDARLMSALAELGGKRTAEDDVAIGGSKITLPAGPDPIGNAIDFLVEYQEAQGAVTAFVRKFRYRPQDVAVALVRGLKTVFGTSGIGRPTVTFFGVTPPTMVAVPIGPGERDTIDAPSGWTEVPMIQGKLCVAPYEDEDLGILGQIMIQCPKRYAAQAEGLFAVVAQELRERSIYKGRALTAQETPQFLDVTGVDPAEVFYTAQVREQLDANLWAMIRHTDRHRQEGLPLKRSVLLHGPYGTGKTLAATLTAQIAEDNGWTFLVVRPGRDSVRSALATAALYGPAIVFVEDIDVLADDMTDNEGIAEILDLFDGMGAKAAEVALVLTTNRPENIHRGLLRPGRLDAMIEIGPLDAQGVQAMLRGLLDPVDLAEIDTEAIAAAMDGWLPAFCREAIGRAQRYRIAHDSDKLTTSALLAAVDGLQPQLAMFTNGRDLQPAPTLDVVLKDAMRQAAARVLDGSRFADTDGDETVYTLNAAPQDNGL